jgi:hypothetical protein
VSAVEKAREAARRAATALRDAESAAQAEAEAVTRRNAERIAAFWQDAGDRITAATNAAHQARAQVVAHLQAGEGSQALDAFLAYRQRHAELAVLIESAKAATATYVWTEVRQLIPDARPSKSNGSYHLPATERIERRMPVSDYSRDHDTPPGNYRITYGAGVPQAVPTAETWERLLVEGIAAGEQAAATTYRAELLEPLQAELEAP